ncbi:hypothetical protein A7982_13781 [Minicystis rosea]|nr:hypothetical protein A7982_13781 [Minicystis rosea]
MTPSAGLGPAPRAIRQHRFALRVVVHQTNHGAVCEAVRVTSVVCEVLVRDEIEHRARGMHLPRAVDLTSNDRSMQRPPHPETFLVHRRSAALMRLFRLAGQVGSFDGPIRDIAPIWIRCPS